MKRLIAGICLFAALAIGSTARAQYFGVYAPPVVYPVVRPVYVAPLVPTLYPAPVVVHRPYVPPVIAPRRRYGFVTPYGGYEVRVPGRPIANTLRTIVP